MDKKEPKTIKLKIDFARNSECSSVKTKNSGCTAEYEAELSLARVKVGLIRKVRDGEIRSFEDLILAIVELGEICYHDSKQHEYTMNREGLTKDEYYERERLGHLERVGKRYDFKCGDFVELEIPVAKFEIK